MAYIYLSIAILAEIIATSCLKAADGFTRPLPSMISIIGYLIALLCLSLTLRDVPTGVAYAIWSGVGTVAMTLIGRLLYGQVLDAPALVGIALITAGVIVMNLLSKSMTD